MFVRLQDYWWSYFRRDRFPQVATLGAALVLGTKAYLVRSYTNPMIDINTHKNEPYEK